MSKDAKNTVGIPAWIEGPFIVGTPEYRAFVEKTGFERIRDEIRKARHEQSSASVHPEAQKSDNQPVLAEGATEIIP
jgi:hypothetical protein